MNSHPSLSQHSKADDGHNPAEPEISAPLQYLATSLLERYLWTIVVARPIDLAVSIDIFRVASRLRPSNHPQRSDTLNNLAIAIFIRYQEGRKGPDLSRAIALCREALRLQRPDQPDHPLPATHFADASLRRLEQHGGDLRLSSIIDRGQNEHDEESGHLNQFQREQATPNNLPPSNGRHEMDPFLMHDAALSDLKRYEREGGPALLTQSIHLFRNSLSLLLPDHPIRLYPLINLTNAIHERYKRDGAEQDLSETIDLHQEALSYQPPGHSNRLFSLCNLALMTFTRYERFGGDRDLTDVIELWREVLSLLPPHHPLHLPTLNNLASTILKRYNGYGRECDLSDAIELYKEVLSLRPHGHPARSGSLCNLSSAIRTRYEKEGRERDLLEGIELSREALSLRPPGHPERSLPLNNLASAILKRYNKGGREQDLSYVIDLNGEALSLHPPGHNERSTSLNNLANAIIKRYERFGGEGDLSDIIRLQKEALSLQPPGHPGRSASLSNLATTLLKLFVRDGRERDLEDVVKLHREALSLRPTNHPDRSVSLNNLANAIHTRYERAGREEDLSDVIELHREALSLVPTGHPDRSLSLNNLANALLTRLHWDREEQDLLDVVELFRDALTLVPPGHPRRSDGLSHLGSAIHTRYEWYREEGDLSDVIELHTEALSLRPINHPNRSHSLNNLANAILMRYQRDDREKDLLDAIKQHREVLSLRPLGHSRRSSSLSNLASAILMRYRRYGEERDLSDVIELRKEVLSLRPPGHPNRSSSLGSLVVAMRLGYGRHGGKQGSAFVEEIIQLLRDAANTGTSPIPDRLHEALRWIDFAVEFARKSALEAYRSAFALLGSAMTLGRSLQARHRNLLSQGTDFRSIKGLALDAARWVLTGTSNSPKLVVELLDQGRNVLLASVGQFRADLSDIRREDPALAEEFYRTSRMLDSAILTGQEISKGKSSHEDSTSRYKRLSAKWEAAVDKIRFLPGCESFLLPVPYIKLQEAATKGPVIIIVVCKERSMAIIVMSKGEPHTVLLPNASEAALKSLHEEWEDALMTLPDHSRVTRKLPRVLSELWDMLVQPIIHVLKDRIGLPLQSRIWWYPTSWASFLPLHAAGSYKKNSPNVPDLYISSYTPTLQALRRAHRDHSSLDLNAGPGLLMVSQPETEGQDKIVGVNAEVEVVQRLVPNVMVLSGDQGTRVNVLREMRDTPWVHLACHGVPDPQDPFQSHFALHGDPLSLLDIITNELPSAEFAYLSACHSAAQDRKLPDEGLTLAGGMQFAGFKSVVGTLWKMADDDAPTLARVFYKSVARSSWDGKAFDCTKTAEALHHAVKELRRKKVPLFRWVNLVHYGI